MKIESIEINKIKPDPNQPRKEEDFVEEDIKNMAESIKSVGVRRPLEVEKINDGFVIITGERRWRASKKAGLQKIPCHVLKDLTTDQKLELQIIGDLHQKGIRVQKLLPAIKRLMGTIQPSKYSNKGKQNPTGEIARRLGISRTHLIKVLKQDKEGITKVTKPRKQDSKTNWMMNKTKEFNKFRDTLKECESRKEEYNKNHPILRTLYFKTLYYLLKDMLEYTRTINSKVTKRMKTKKVKKKKSPRITLELVEDDYQRFLFNQIVRLFHTYKPKTDLLGRRIDWLVKNHDRVVGAVGIGSSVMAMKPRDEFIGWNKEQRTRNLTKTATNWRFCLIQRGIGSAVLSKLLKESKKEWFKKYGDRLVFLETLIGGGYDGTCYKAGGWTQVGITKGYQFKWKEKEDIIPSDKVVMNSLIIGGKVHDKYKVISGTTDKKKIFVKTLHRYWKRELCK